VLLGFCGLFVLATWVDSASDRDAARRRAHTEIDALKAVHCTPDIAEDFDRANTANLEAELGKSTLDGSEKEVLEAEFSNAMELSGCGFNSRYQVKPVSKRARSR
jgi:alkylhydroperoxidase family enzyme